MVSGSTSTGAELIIVKMRFQKKVEESAIFSRTLASVGGSEIGLKSLCIEMGGLTLGAGMTSANFKMRRTYPSRTEVLNIAATGSLIRGANSLNSQFGTPSGQVQ